MTAALAVLVDPLLGATKSSSSGSSTLLIFVVIGAAFYFFIFRPQQRKTKAARQVMNQFEVGDEVLTAGGLVGTVIDIEDDRVTVETSMGASFVVLKQYVLRKLSSDVDLDHDHGVDEDWDGDDTDEGDHDHGQDEGGPNGEDEADDHGSPNGDDEHGTSTPN
jgi:preprotein translocase subunit YajC